MAAPAGSVNVSEEEKKAFQRMQLKGLMTECFDEWCDTLVNKTLAALEKGKEVKIADVAATIQKHNDELRKELEAVKGDLQETKNTATSGLSTLKTLMEDERSKNATRDKKLELTVADLKTELGAKADAAKAAAEKSITEQQKFHQTFREAVSEEMIDNCPNCGFEKSKPYEKDAGACTACKSVYSNIDKARGFRKCAACGYPIAWKEEKKEPK